MRTPDIPERSLRPERRRWTAATLTDGISDINLVLSQCIAGSSASNITLLHVGHCSYEVRIVHLFVYISYFLTSGSHWCFAMGRKNAVTIVTGYGLEDRGLFPHSVQTGSRTHPASFISKVYSGILFQVKAVRRTHDTLPQLCTAWYLTF
jgi:hypothetical protein